MRGRLDITATRTIAARRSNSRNGTHLIFWSFVPRVQLEGERQPTKVEMEQLLCSIVNWKKKSQLDKAIVQNNPKAERLMLARWFGLSTSWVSGSKRLVYLLYCRGNGLRVEMDSTETHTHTHTVSATSISIQTGCAALVGEASERSKQLNKRFRETLQQEESIKDGAAVSITHWSRPSSPV